MERWEPPHDPDEIETRDIDFADRLAPGETLSSASWTSTPAGLTQISASVDQSVATWKFSGGTAGADYEITCRALTTPGGNTLEETVILRCRAR